MQEDELSLLQRRWRLTEQNVMSMNDFAFMYRQASLGTRMAFDAWRNRQASAPSPYTNPLMPAGQVLAPPVVYLPPVSYVVPRREMVMPPPMFAPAPAPLPAAPPPRREPVGTCSGCGIGLDFDPPRSQRPLTVRCPRCLADSSFQVCWTCPAVIAYDSTCRHCFERDKARARSNSQLPLIGPSNSDADLAAALLASGAGSYPSSAAAAAGSPAAFASARIPEEKGLSNRAGDNHCFLNVTIQSLWHLKPFRDLFEARPVQHPPSCPCVYCALTTILTNYRYAATNTLAPDVLRQSLGLLYARESKFQVGELSDATECFDAICTSLHQVVAGSVEKTCDPICCAHSSFRLLVEDRCACRKCGTVASDVQSMFLHYVYASEIVRRFTKVSVRSSKKSFEKILHKLNRVEPRRCAKCDSLVPVQRLLLKPWPKIFALCIAWADSNPPVAEVASFLAAVEQEVDVANIFDQATAFVDRGKRYRLRGVICYYLKHYAAYFFNDKEGVWFSFDDVSVHEVGPTWKDVMRKCRMGHQKPVLLFFEEVTQERAEDSPVVQARHRSLKDRFAGRHH